MGAGPHGSGAIVDFGYFPWCRVSHVSSPLVSLKLDLPLHTVAGEPAEAARVLAASGVSGAYSFEGPNDVFVPLIRAAGADIDLYSNIAVSFPRSPVHLAHMAWELQQLTGGRFMLGLGSQIKPHIERRYGAAFDRPAERMADQVDAIRAVFAAWQDGVALNHDGPFWKLDLMPPLFNPGPLEWGPPPILVAAVGPLMTAAAADHADGILLHPFSSERFVQERSIPQIVACAPRDDFVVIGGAIAAIGSDWVSQADADEAARGLVAFYGSTPAYRPVLDIEGHGELQPELRRLSKENRWDEMSRLIDDTVLDAVVVRGSATEVAAKLRARFDGVAQRVAVTVPHGLDPATIKELTDSLG